MPTTMDLDESFQSNPFQLDPFQVDLFQTDLQSDAFQQDLFQQDGQDLLQGDGQDLFQGDGKDLFLGEVQDLFQQDGQDLLQGEDQDLFPQDSQDLVKQAPIQPDPFQPDLDFLQDLTVPTEQKRWMLDIIFDDIVPYRFGLGPRLFPELNFYSILLTNRANFNDIWPFVTRFHGWISPVAVTSPDAADNAVKALAYLKVRLGISETLSPAATPLSTPVQPSPLQAQAAVAPADVFATGEAVQQKMPKNKKTIPAQGTQPVSENGHGLLTSELKRPATFTYRGIIRDSEHFSEMQNAYDRHVRRKPGLGPEEDPSWPGTAEKQREYVHTMSNSITNTSDFYELRKARERLAAKTGQKGADDESRDQNVDVDMDTGSGGQNGEVRTGHMRSLKRKRGDSEARPKGVSKADWDLVDDENTPVDLLSAVIHHRITDVEIELLCWKLLLAAMDSQRGFTLRPLWSGQRTVSTWDHYDSFAERWAAMCDELLDCKILVHSLTRADWVVKFASAPAKERSAKLSNDLLNGRRDVQNHVGREVIKAKTSTRDWTTSEDFEIRTRNGDIIYKGVQIGDKTRRQLAVRRKAQGA